MKLKGATIITTLLLAGCGGSSYVIDDDDGPGPNASIDPTTVPDATPRKEAYTRRGNPDSYVVYGQRYYVRHSNTGFTQRGVASWYGNKFHGRLTSSGEPYNMYAMTAAHKTLRIPTYVRVTNLRNGRQVVVRVNDRGPFVKNRIIDLSYVAAKKLGITGEGTGLVEIEVVGPGSKPVQVRKAPAAPRPQARHASGGNRLFVQVGAFSSAHNARRLRHRLQQIINIQIRIEPTLNQQQQKIFRVRIGPLTTVADADRTASKLEQHGHKSRIVID